MIRAMVFDLDGTLVQTEKLKAISYARAAVELRPQDLREDQVLEAFKSVVGRPGREVAQRLVEMFDLEEAAKAREEEFGFSAPWQAFVQIRLKHYEGMLANPEVILKNQWPHTMAVLDEARRANCKTGLATMSRCEQARYVLQILQLEDAFHFIATRDEVEPGKPDPEICRLIADELQIPPDNCLVPEDSPSGVQAAVAAGMGCIAVTTPFPREGMHTLGILAPQWIVDDTHLVADTVRKMVAEQDEH